MQTHVAITYLKLPPDPIPKWIMFIMTVDWGWPDIQAQRADLSIQTSHWSPDACQATSIGSLQSLAYTVVLTLHLVIVEKMVKLVQEKVGPLEIPVR